MYVSEIWRVREASSLRGFSISRLCVSRCAHGNPREPTESSSSFPCQLVDSGTNYACYETGSMTENYDPRKLSRPRHVFLQDIWNETKTMVYNKSSSPKSRTHHVDEQADYYEAWDTDTSCLDVQINHLPHHWWLTSLDSYMLNSNVSHKELSGTVTSGLRGTAKMTHLPRISKPCYSDTTSKD